MQKTILDILKQNGDLNHLNELVYILDSKNKKGINYIFIQNFFKKNSSNNIDGNNNNDKDNNKNEEGKTLKKNHSNKDLSKKNSRGISPINNKERDRDSLSPYSSSRYKIKKLRGFSPRNNLKSKPNASSRNQNSPLSKGNSKTINVHPSNYMHDHQ